jgi:hypothetical protein
MADLEGVKALSEIEQQLRVEAGADLAGEHEVVAIVVADEQRPEADAGTRGSVKPPTTRS